MCRLPVVFVNAAMTLMLGIAERGGEVLLYGLEIPA